MTDEMLNGERTLDASELENLSLFSETISFEDAEEIRRYFSNAFVRSGKGDFYSEITDHELRGFYLLLRNLGQAPELGKHYSKAAEYLEGYFPWLLGRPAVAA